MGKATATYGHTVCECVTVCVFDCVCRVSVSVCVFACILVRCAYPQVSSSTTTREALIIFKDPRQSDNYFNLDAFNIHFIPSARTKEKFKTKTKSS